MTKQTLERKLSQTQAMPHLIYWTWGVTLCISALPDIVWVEFTHGDARWLVFPKMGLLLVLIGSAFRWPSLRPLRNYFIVMLAFFGLSEVRHVFNFTWPALQALFGNTIFDERMQAEQTGKFVLTLALLVVLLVLGYNRRDFFLARGNLNAFIKPVPWLGFPKRDPWPWFGLQWGFYIAGALAMMQYLALRPSGEVLWNVIPILPSILWYAALNAFNEEFTYRAPMLATLEPVSGSQPALWLSAYFFGIAHYFGTPGGVVGGLASIFMGWILSKGMIETRGFFWAWWIHFLSDVAIFTFVTVALLK